MAMRPRPIVMITPATIPRVGEALGTLRDPKAIASTMRQMVSLFHPDALFGLAFCG